MAINDCARVRGIDLAINTLDELMRLIQSPSFRVNGSLESHSLMDTVREQVKAFLADRCGCSQRCSWVATLLAPVAQVPHRGQGGV
jgi:hypothetical protein